MTPIEAIGWRTPADPQWARLMAAHAGARPARVVEQHRSGYVVAEGPGEGHAAESPQEWQRAPNYRKGGSASEERAAVGDWVLIEGAGARSRIVALLPRHSAIKRGAAGEHYRQQVIAANIDTVFVVCGLDADFNPRRIERYLLLVQGSGSAPVVVLTKLDKAADAAAALAALADIAAQAVPVLAVNAKDPDSVAVLAPWLQPGATAVLVGSSGAGKSTLTNTLLGRDRMKTAEVRDSDARGRHTTTHRALIPLPSGACLIDTPGMRELKLAGDEDLGEAGFADIETLAMQCRFGDCAHVSEPGCAVRAALESGALAIERWTNFVKLRSELAATNDTLEAQLRRKTQARVANKALNKRLGEKYRAP